jgi:hypothetical protein
LPNRKMPKRLITFYFPLLILPSVFVFFFANLFIF